jgi:hypothetical protein
VTIAPESIQGTVASKTTTTIVVTTTAGKTVTVDVSLATKYSVRGVSAPTLANVTVGDRLTAQGTLNSDGSLAATVVQASANDQPGFGGNGPGGGFGPGGGIGRGGIGRGGGFGGRNSKPIAAPSTSASGSST